MTAIDAVAPAATAAVFGRPDRVGLVAREFEAVFLGAMFEEMFAGLDEEGPFGAAGGTGVWRSLLTDEFARSIANAGGIGLADHVRRELIALQEMRP